MKKVIKFYIILDIFIAVWTPIFGLKWLVNSQISFALTMLIVFASFRSYSSLIESEIRSGRFDSFESDSESLRGVNLRAESLKDSEILRGENLDDSPNLRGESLSSSLNLNSENSYDENLDESDLPKLPKTKQITSFLSPLKLLGYTLLGASFYLLAKFEFIHPFAFLVGVLPLPLGTMIGAFFDKD